MLSKPLVFSSMSLLRSAQQIKKINSREQKKCVSSEHLHFNELL